MVGGVLFFVCGGAMFGRPGMESGRDMHESSASLHFVTIHDPEYQVTS